MQIIPHAVCDKKPQTLKGTATLMSSLFLDNDKGNFDKLNIIKKGNVVRNRYHWMQSRFGNSSFLLLQRGSSNYTTLLKVDLVV